MMKKVLLTAVAAVALSAGSALAADMPVKAKPIVAPPPSAWDVAFGAAVMNDYIFRGVTQSNHKVSGAVYFEPRYNINADTQLYVGIAGETISFPNNAKAEVDIYGGIRPTFGKLATDFGVWYYWYPGGTCFNTTVGGCSPTLANGNVIKKDVSFIEYYAKATYNFSDAFNVGANIFYSPSVLNSGAPGTYVSGTSKYTFPAFSNGVAIYTSGELGYWALGTSDSFYGTGIGTVYANGIPYKSYTTWNLGVGATWKQFTLDLRYSDTNLSKGDCNAFTSDHTASGTTNVTPINPGGAGSNWCGAAFVAKLSVDMTASTLGK